MKEDPDTITTVGQPNALLVGHLIDIGGRTYKVTKQVTTTCYHIYPWRWYHHLWEWLCSTWNRLVKICALNLRAVAARVRRPARPDR